MRIPMVQNYAAMPGGAFDASRIANAQAKYAPMQAEGNAMLPMMQAKFMPYQMQLQAMSNPLLWMMGSQDPAMMKQMTTNMMNSLPQMNNMNNMNSGNSGGILGNLINHFMNHSGSASTNTGNLGNGANSSPDGSSGQAVRLSNGVIGYLPAQSQDSGNANFPPPSMLPLIQKEGITGATAIRSMPGWYHGYQNGKEIQFRMQP